MPADSERGVSFDGASDSVRPPWSASPAEVEAFVNQYGRPHDPTTDEYDDPGPFAFPVKAGKNSPIYNAHSYHTKVPPEGIVPYLEHYTRPGDLVLDPFCGSGMTGVASLMTGRHAILNDLSPAATHIAHSYTHPVDPATLRREFARVKDAVQGKFDWLYGTICERGHPATILYTIWSDLHRCKSCAAEIVLWDAAVNHETGDVLDEISCPACGKGPWKRADLPFVRSDPVMTVLECPSCLPHRSEHRTTVNEMARISEIQALPIPDPVPMVPFDQHREMWRGGHRQHGIHSTRDFWTMRNLHGLARLHAEFERSPLKELRPALRFLFTSVLPNSARTTRYRFHKAGNGPVSGTLYVPSFTVENNILWLMERKLQDIGAAFECLGEFVPFSVLTTLHAGQSLLIAPNTVDYVFTDPPFGSNIFYADCSLLWEAWLGYFTDERFEAVWNKHRKPAEGGKTLEDYERLMTEAFREMYRVLKPGRWASVVFHNSDDRVWQAIQRGATTAGFELVNALQFDKQQLTFKGIKGEKGEEDVTNKDIVLNLQKPRAGSANGFVLAPDVEAVIADALEEHLRSSPEDDERGLQPLQGHAIRALINHGYQVDISWQSVRDTLRHLGCKQVDGRWYLPGDEVAGVGLALEIHDEASAIAWLRSELETQGPQTRGTLTPRFQQATVGVTLPKPLIDLLEENFVLDERSNRWRLPSAEEREQLNDSTRLRQRREIARILEGHPSRDYSDNELADLAVEAYGMRMYRAVEPLGSLVSGTALPHDKHRLLEQVQTAARMKLEAEEATQPRQDKLL